MNFVITQKNIDKSKEAQKKWTEYNLTGQSGFLFRSDASKMSAETSSRLLEVHF